MVALHWVCWYRTRSVVSASKLNGLSFNPTPVCIYHLPNGRESSQINILWIYPPSAFLISLFSPEPVRHSYSAEQNTASSSAGIAKGEASLVGDSVLLMRSRVFNYTCLCTAKIYIGRSIIREDISLICSSKWSPSPSISVCANSDCRQSTNNVECKWQRESAAQAACLPHICRHVGYVRSRRIRFRGIGPAERSAQTSVLWGVRVR